MTPFPRGRHTAPVVVLQCALLVGGLAAPARSAEGPSLPGTEALEPAADRSADMVAGVGRMLRRLRDEVVAGREARWRPDFRDRAAYEASVAPQRARLAAIIGLADARVPDPALRWEAAPGGPAVRAESPAFTVLAVRWPVLAGLEAEGLLLRPRGTPRARVVFLTDADQDPESVSGLRPGLAPARQFARRLAEQGCEVLVPRLLNREDTHSGNPALGRLTNQTHREWIYRQAYPLGRHPLGYEVQQALAAVDAWARAAERLPVAVAGWGEGGLLALLCGALDPRLEATLVSGHFGPREDLADEPLYRNLFGFLREFGDAELGRLIAPRTLLVEPAAAPEVAGPPAVRPGRAGAAPGRIVTPPLAEVEREVARAQALAGPWAPAIRLVPVDGAAREPLGAPALRAFRVALGLGDAAPVPPGADPVPTAPAEDPGAAQHRWVRAVEAHAQQLITRTRQDRDTFLWGQVKSTDAEAWRRSMAPYRERFRTEVIGAWTPPGGAPRVRSRPLTARAGWTGHEVVIELGPDVFAWGHLLLPRDLRPGERRPAVVAQHGLEGLPEHVWDEDPAGRNVGVYRAFAARLAERGFVVFAPHNPYRGPDFRQLQRAANPLGLSLFAIITAQHAAILDWLGALPAVDPARIAFYGLSYGGSTAMRVPALLERYAAVICSGNFNEWVWKLSTTSWPSSYVFTKEYEMPEFNLGPTFGHAEMAALIAPRPFMVERGHADGVGIDEWVSFEYARVRRLYARLGIPGRTEIEYFDGGHAIRGEGTFRFLHHHLGWPAPAARR